MCGLPDGSARLWSCIPDLISKAPRELCAWGRTHGPVATDSARGDGPWSDSSRRAALGYPPMASKKGESYHCTDGFRARSEVSGGDASRGVLKGPWPSRGACHVSRRHGRLWAPESGRGLGPRRAPKPGPPCVAVVPLRGRGVTQGGAPWVHKNMAISV